MKILLGLLLFIGGSVGAAERDYSKYAMEDLEAYNYGEISRTSLVVGGLLGSIVGFGTGHLVYGKYAKRGWLFTVGEAGTLLLYLDSAKTSIPGYALLGALAGLRIWQIIDVWTLPGSHNRRYRTLKGQLEGPPADVGLSPMIMPRANAAPIMGLRVGLNF